MSPRPVQVHFDSPHNCQSRSNDGALSRRPRPHRPARTTRRRRSRVCDSANGSSILPRCLNLHNRLHDIRQDEWERHHKGKSFEDFSKSAKSVCGEGSKGIVNTSARAWLIEGIETMTCKPLEDMDLLQNILSTWKHASVRKPKDLWNPRAGCFTKETYRVLLENMSIANEVPSLECVPLPRLRGARRVQFNLTASVHEVIPYEEIYGDHPRTFVFDRWSRKIAAAPCGFVSLQAWMFPHEDEDDEQLHNESDQ